METLIEPVFDPQNVGASLRMIDEQLPMRAVWLQGTIVGEVASRRKGQGFELDGTRDYEYGDDPRHIDHQATARHPEQWPQIREHYGDITPALWIVTDALQSRNRFNPGYFAEQNLALSAVTALMRIAHVHNMPSAVIAVDDKGFTVRQQEPLQGREHVYQTAQQLARPLNSASVSVDRRFWQRRQRVQPEDLDMHLSGAIRYAAQSSVESMVAVVSDFRDVAFPDDEEHGWEKPLKQLTKQGNDIIAIELTNPQDYELPAEATRFLTPNGVVWVGQDKKSQKIRSAFREAAQTQQEAINTALSQANIRHITLSTSDPLWLTSLRKQLRIAAKQNRAA